METLILIACIGASVYYGYLMSNIIDSRRK